MKRQWSFFAIVLVSVSSVHAFKILVDGYTLENYASYSSTTYSSRMVFDGSGNLYINHFDDGKIQKIDGTRQVSTLVTGLTSLFDMTWGGGTAYGNYLYTANHPTGNHQILKIDLTNGNVTQFTSMGNEGPCAINIDRTGNYNNQMYVGTGGNDRIVKVNTSRTVSQFTSWPGPTGGGGVYGLAFDTTGNYSGKMYAATLFGSANADISGLFMVNPDGTVSRFCNSLAAAGVIDFDTTGTYFDHSMFVTARTNFTNPLTLWRVSTNGVAEEFMRGVNSLTFGDDGTMYVSYYNVGTQMVSVARVVPEPATLMLLAAGGLFLKRRSV